MRNQNVEIQDKFLLTFEEASKVLWYRLKKVTEHG